MGQRDGFAGGFLLGTLVGGVLGGMLASVLVAGRDEEDERLPGHESTSLDSEESIEFARRSLEDKIAQLNLAIDDVRLQLGNVNGNPPEQNVD